MAKPKPKPFAMPILTEHLARMPGIIRAALDEEIRVQGHVFTLRAWFGLNDDQARLIALDLAGAVAETCRRTTLDPERTAETAWALWRQVAMTTMKMGPGGGIAEAQATVEAWLADSATAGKPLPLSVWWAAQAYRR